MNYEVELKFRLEDRKRLEGLLAKRDAHWAAETKQVDTYLAHPSRDFADTDEALRIRQDGNRFFVTYKGPKLDALTKTREEIELPIGPEAQSQMRTDWLQFFEKLGFQEVATVDKVRRTTRLTIADSEVSVVFDQVSGLGDFVELEQISSAERLDRDRQTILALASDLGLANPLRESYLELLLKSSK